MDPRDVIRVKRDGGRLGPELIDDFLTGYVEGRVEDYHASALLMAIFCHGLDDVELLAWTRSMLESGTTFDWSHLDGPMVDKHSTGGVGDKVSIPLAPALVACGAKVPMISGRGLGHTGGTLDKLEAYPGLRTELPIERIRSQMEELGFFIAAQTPDLVPADRKLYALRDAAGLVEAIPLIASSILSKKLAEGLDALVLDVKFGAGSFLPDHEKGLRLAGRMAGLAKGFGLPMTVVLSSMEQPLGRMVGHANEINESLDCLRGEGPRDLVDLTVRQGGEALLACGLAEVLQAGEDRMRASFSDGSAMEVFQHFLKAQGAEGDLSKDLPTASGEAFLVAPKDGYLACLDCRQVGVALQALGGARVEIGGGLDHGVGLEVLARHGDWVEGGQPLVHITHRDGKGVEEAQMHLARAYQVALEPPNPVGETRTLV
ncbi:MAG: thymidine phosphorylase [bacterium]|nr:thymidine phosphorylase [bacterium]